jgi:predicted dehydrogenase
VDVVILATPPHFRPTHFAAAIRAGKHVFMEKPVAVDSVGVRTVIAAGEEARRRKISVVAGTQRRHEASYLQAMQLLRDGAIGDVIAARCFWNQGGLWKNDRQPGWSDMEWQLRNWLYFTWLSGDHIVEQHVHNIDVCNWAISAHPVRALGVGGRQARTQAEYGHVFDHFAVEFEYPNSQFVLSMCRQQDGCPGRVEEIIHGTRGRLMTTTGGAAKIVGEKEWRFDGDNPNPFMVEHKDLIDSIRGGTYRNEAQQIAESTLSAIMGRMAAYTGQVVEWETALNSTEDLSPRAYEFGPMDVPGVAIPGMTKLV